jgi:hypothetical protein
MDTYLLVTRTFLGVKRSGREDGHSPPSTEVKNEWSYTATPPVYIDGMQRGNFTFLQCTKIRVLVSHYFISVRCNVPRACRMTGTVMYPVPVV